MSDIPEVPTERVEVMKWMIEAQIYKQVAIHAFKVLRDEPAAKMESLFNIVEMMRAGYPISPNPTAEDLAIADHFNLVLDEIQKNIPPT